MHRIAVFGLLLALPAAAQIRTRILDPSTQSSIVAGRIATNGDLVIGGDSTNGELPIVNAFQKGYSSSGLLRTRDGGRTWSPVQRPLRTNFTLLADPIQPDTVFALDISGLYRSTDAGDRPRSLYMASNGDAILTGSLKDSGTFVTRISANGSDVRYALSLPAWNWLAQPNDDAAIFTSLGTLVFVPLTTTAEMLDAIVTAAHSTAARNRRKGE
ncbi:MAG: hypothetical protein U0R19_35910 [Bryobacteraceae bacterium]